MKFVIKATNFELSTPVKNFIEKELKLLEKFIKKFLIESEAKAWVEIAKVTRHHQKGPIFYAECQLRVGKISARSEVLHENLKSAIIQMKEELEGILRKEKEKRLAKMKRGARKAKRKLKVSELAKKKEGQRILQEAI